MLTRIFTATTVASLALGLVAACSPPTTPTEAASADMVKMALPHAKMANFTLKDTAGKAHELYKMTDAKAIVISMHTRGCPIGQQLNPDFHALQAKYEAKGVKFMMINPNVHDTPEMIAKEAKEFDITMPILKDSDQSVTEPWGVPATVADAAPLPAMMPATCVPWPSTSRRIAGTESTAKTMSVTSRIPSGSPSGGTGAVLSMVRMPAECAARSAPSTATGGTASGASAIRAGASRCTCADV